MKKLFWLFLFAGLFWSCSDNDEDDSLHPEPSPGDDSITVMAYLLANNNLDDFMVDNVCFMYDGLATMTEKATLLIYWDGETAIGENASRHLLLKYETDGKGNINGRKALDASAKVKDILNEATIVKEYPEQVSTDKQVMASVLKDMVSEAPTSRYGLIYGSHGSSWLDTITTRALGYDGSYSNSILLPDMVEAMEGIGKPFDFLLFDACYMGTAEVCYEFRHVADYQISSVMEVPAYGFPYDLLLKDLYKGTVEGYKQACRTFIDFYKSEYDSGYTAWGTIALVDSKEVQPLTNLIKQEIVSNKVMLASYSAGGLQEYGRQAGYGIAYDLEHFVKDLNGGNAPQSFKAQLDKTILYKGCLEDARYSMYDYDVDATNFCGMGIYIPTAGKAKWNSYFKTLDWYTASGWNEVGSF